MSTVTALKTTCDSWTSVFPKEIVSQQESLLFMKRLIAVVISDVTYLRGIFPDDVFTSKHLNGVNVKILKNSTEVPQVMNLINCLKGVFDAIEKQYLKTFIFVIHPANSDEKASDIYKFQFKYGDGEDISISRNGKTISDAKYFEKTKASTLQMLRTLIIATSTLDPLPNDFTMSITLTYYDDVTPEEYQPPHFMAADENEKLYDDENCIDHLPVGQVPTKFHNLKFDLVTENSREITGKVNQERMKDDNKVLDEHNISDDAMNNVSKLRLDNLPIKNKTLQNQSSHNEDSISSFDIDSKNVKDVLKNKKIHENEMNLHEVSKLRLHNLPNKVKTPKNQSSPNEDSASSFDIVSKNMKDVLRNKKIHENEMNLQESNQIKKNSVIKLSKESARVSHKRSMTSSGSQKENTEEDFVVDATNKSSNKKAKKASRQNIEQ